MRIKTIEIHNFKAFQNTKIKSIGAMGVFLGENGAHQIKWRVKYANSTFKIWADISATRTPTTFDFLDLQNVSED